MSSSAERQMRRYLCLWFPRLLAEQAARAAGLAPTSPVAIIGERGTARIVVSVGLAAERQGVRRDQSLSDALALCPGLVTRPLDPEAGRGFLTALRRWAGQFSPWVAEEVPDGLMLDITGCAHLFGGEEGLLLKVESDCAGFGLSLRAGLAETPGAAWALSRFAGQEAHPLRNGDAIDQEAHATRSRAGKRRHWSKGGDSPAVPLAGAPSGRIAPPGRLLASLGGLPVAGLRLSPDALEAANALGLRRIEDLVGMPRGALARRLGPEVLDRLDKTLGRVPDAMTPAPPPVGFGVRLSLPEPIGTAEDLLAAIDRLLPPLAAKLTAFGVGARKLRLETFRSDHTRQRFDIGLARPTVEAADLRPVLKMQIDRIEPGFGIDVVRLEAVRVERCDPAQSAGLARGGTGGARSEAAFQDLLSRLGTRVGLEAITLAHPGDSHVPEKAAVIYAAAWAAPVQAWPVGRAVRPLTLSDIELVHAAPGPDLPQRLRWRGRDEDVVSVDAGPERVAPEWWLDDPAWRSGLRDYWCVTTAAGARLWVCFAHGAEISGGWFCHGQFA